MSRYLTANQNSLSSQNVVALRQLADIGVTSGTVYACNGYRYLFTMGNTYSPVGMLGGIEPIQEESDPFPRGLKMWLAAINSSQLYEPLREQMFNRPVKVYEVFLEPETFALTNTPELRWQGLIDEVEIRFQDPERGNYYEVGAETDLRRTPKRAFFNHESQFIAFSGDLFFDWMPIIPTYRSMWGQQQQQYAPPSVPRPPGGYPPNPRYRS